MTLVMQVQPQIYLAYFASPTHESTKSKTPAGLPPGPPKLFVRRNQLKPCPPAGFRKMRKPGGLERLSRSSPGFPARQSHG